MIDKYESRRIRVEIRHVPVDVWDPIGIKDEPNAQDEYDGYLGGVYELLVGGAVDEFYGGWTRAGMADTALAFGGLKESCSARNAIRSRVASGLSACGAS